MSIRQASGNEHLVYDGQEFDIEDADGGRHTIIADSLEQAIDIARERGIDFCTQEGEDEDAEDEGDE